MKRLLYILLFFPLGLFGQTQIINVGTTANDGSGDKLRVAMQKINLNTYATQDSFAVYRALYGDIFTKSETNTTISEAFTTELANAVDIRTVGWLMADSNTLGNPVTLTYFNNNAGSGSGDGFDVDKVEFIVGTTSGAPANADTSFTIAQLASKEIKLYRGTTADLHLQYLNRTATNGVTGYRFNSSGVIVVRPAWATGDRAYIEGIPTANANWLTLSSAAAYFTETFEATGYDNAVWSENVGSGSFVDEDETGVTPPVDGTKTLQITKVSPNFNAASVGTLAADQVVSYLTFYVMINAHGLASGEVMTIMQTWLDGYGDDISGMGLYVDSYDSNNLKFYFEINNDGTGVSSTNWPGSGSAVALDTWYKVNIKYDVTGDTYEVKITPSGGSEATVTSGSLTDTHPTGGLRLIKLGNTSDSETCNIYFDNVAVGTTAYPTF